MDLGLDGAGAPVTGGVAGSDARSRWPLPGQLCGGAVVNVSAMNAGGTGSIGGSVRNIAVVAITKNLADELGADGIPVTCVDLGPSVTKRAAADAAFRELASGNARARPVTADEVAAVITFLASPRAAVATGSVVTVDGGRTGPIWA